MLNVFPNLFSYSLIAPFVFRLVVGGFLLFFAYAHLRGAGVGTFASAGRSFLSSAALRRTLSLLEAVSGLLLVVGFLTQVAALLASLIFVSAVILERKSAAGFSVSIGFFFLLLVVASSLLLLGPGFYAFDWPL